jgi:hypothetical protein
MRHDHPYFIKDPSNNVNHPTGFPMWNGWGSIAHHSGPMFRYILYTTASRPEKTVVLSSCSDDIFTIPDGILEQAKKDNVTVIAPILCSFGPTIRKEYMYIPAHDEYFIRNMYDIFAPHRISWEEKINKVVWRGGLSGEMLRINTVKQCLNIPYTDVKLIDNWPRDEYNLKKTPELFADRIEAFEQCRYKAVFWIDGNCIPSNVLWVFATGSVPVIINETYYWFKDKIKPWVHYVPINADLSDLEKNIRWIFENDTEARKIAENALEFARTELTPEKQQLYLRDEIDRRIRENNDPLNSPPIYPQPVEKLMPLLSFGGMAAAERYVRRRAALLVEILRSYYDKTTRNAEHIQRFIEIAKEINISNYPEVDEIMKEVVSMLKKDFPDFPVTQENE